MRLRHNQSERQRMSDSHYPPRIDAKLVAPMYYSKNIAFFCSETFEPLYWKLMPNWTLKCFLLLLVPESWSPSPCKNILRRATIRPVAPHHDPLQLVLRPSRCEMPLPGGKVNVSLSLVQWFAKHLCLSVGCPCSCVSHPVRVEC